MNFLLAIEKSDYADSIIQTKGLVETLLFGGKMLLIGLLTVFSVLCLVWIALSLFKLVFHDLNQKKRAVSVKNVVEVVADPTPTHEANNEEEIIAVIAAAIAAAESESSGVKFRVVSFNRK